MGVHGICGCFSPSCLPDESQEEKLVRDQRCPEVMPGLEPGTFCFPQDPPV